MTFTGYLFIGCVIYCPYTLLFTQDKCQCRFTLLLSNLQGELIQSIRSGERRQILVRVELTPVGLVSDCKPSGSSLLFTWRPRVLTRETVPPAVHTLMSIITLRFRSFRVPP